MSSTGTASTGSQQTEGFFKKNWWKLFNVTFFIILFVLYSVFLWDTGMKQKENEKNPSEQNQLIYNSSRNSVLITLAFIVLFIVMIGYIIFSTKKDICQAIIKTASS